MDDVDDILARYGSNAKRDGSRNMGSGSYALTSPVNEHSESTGYDEVSEPQELLMDIQSPRGRREFSESKSRGEAWELVIDLLLEKCSEGQAQNAGLDTVGKQASFFSDGSVHSSCSTLPQEESIDRTEAQQRMLTEKASRVRLPVDIPEMAEMYPVDVTSEMDPVGILETHPVDVPEMDPYAEQMFI